MDILHQCYASSLVTEGHSVQPKIIPPLQVRSDRPHKKGVSTAESANFSGVPAVDNLQRLIEAFGHYWSLEA
jgi:hypothetical protein